MNSIYYTVYDSNTQALAQRAFENNLISDYLTKLRGMTNVSSMHILYDYVWYAIDELSEFLPTDRIEHLQKYVADELRDRFVQMYTPQERNDLVTIRLSNPVALRRDLVQALNLPSGPLRSLEISFVEYLLSLIQNQADIPARNYIMSKEEAMFGKCWRGYTKVGMKNKSGRRVPNCVRK